MSETTSSAIDEPAATDPSADGTEPGFTIADNVLDTTTLNELSHAQDFQQRRHLYATEAAETKEHLQEKEYALHKAALETTMKPDVSPRVAAFFRSYDKALGGTLTGMVHTMENQKIGQAGRAFAEALVQNANAENLYYTLFVDENSPIIKEFGGIERIREDAQTEALIVYDFAATLHRMGVSPREIDALSERTGEDIRATILFLNEFNKELGSWKKDVQETGELKTNINTTDLESAAKLYSLIGTVNAFIYSEEAKKQ